MKKLTTFFIAVISFMLITASNSFAVEEKAEYFPEEFKVLSMEAVYEANDNIYIRKEPSADSDKIGQIYKGNKLTALGKVQSLNWLMVMVAGQKGFVFMPLLDLIETIEDPDETKVVDDKTLKEAEKTKAAEAQAEAVVIAKRKDDKAAIPIDEEKALEEWKKIKDSIDIDTLKAFVANFPDSMYAKKASTRITAIERVQKKKDFEQEELENTLVMKTRYGVVAIEMFPGIAPKHIRRIKELVRKKFYNGLKFHRVIADFMAQTGDPTGTGSGGSGQNIPAEFSNLKHLRGTVSMARTPNDEDSADSQFFICLKDQKSLDGKYTIWGQVIYGMPAIDSLEKATDDTGIVENPDIIQMMDVAADVFDRMPREWIESREKNKNLQ